MRPDDPAPAVTLRFAPSPNGLLHLGHAYSALMNARASAALKGRLLLRFDDLDRTRSRRQYKSAIERDLEWLGVRFDAPARRESDHVADYDAALARLAAQGLTYPVFAAGRTSPVPRPPTTPMERRSIRAPAGRLPRMRPRRGLRRATGPSGASKCGAHSSWRPRQPTGSNLARGRRPRRGSASLPSGET